MRLLDRYVLRNHLTFVGYCFASFSMLYVIGDLFDRLPRFIEARASLSVVLSYYGSLLSLALEFLAPASLLLGTLYTLWLMARHNELTAVRASGVSLHRTMYPVIAVGIVSSLAVLAVNEFVSPGAARWTDSVTRGDFGKSSMHVFRDVSYYYQDGAREWRIRKIKWGKRVLFGGVRIVQEREDGSRDEYSAKAAEWLDEQWWFHGLTVQRYDANGRPVGDMKWISPARDALVEVTGFQEKAPDMLEDIKPSPVSSAYQLYRDMVRRKGVSEEKKAERLFDFHSRLAMPWACLAVTLFGFPAGSRAGRQNILVGILLAMGCFFGYYALYQIGTLLGKGMVLSPWLSAWLANLVFLSVGVGMGFRIN